MPTYNVRYMRRQYVYLDIQADAPEQAEEALGNLQPDELDTITYHGDEPPEIVIVDDSSTSPPDIIVRDGVAVWTDDLDGDAGDADA